MFNPEAIKQQFPIFKQKTPLGQDLVYLDNAATCQKPQAVIDRITDFYAKEYGTVGRSSYWPATETTKNYNEVRGKVQRLLNTAYEEEIVFTSGTTDAINKVANSFLRPRLNAGDVVIISEMEHHANLIPWQQICAEKGAALNVIPMLDSGELDYEALESLLTNKVKLLAVTGVSNALGIKNDLLRIIKAAKGFEVPVFIDAAQSVAHSEIDVVALDCDFLVFSGHKIYGPTGVGVLFGKRERLREMAPLSYGGGIVKEVTIEAASFQQSPNKHEAGTPNIAGVIGLGAALDFINEIGYAEISAHTKAITDYAIEQLKAMEGIQVIGDVDDRAPVISFVMEGVHAHDLSTFLNEKGICIRAGHHCAQPLMHRLNLIATARISFAIYNTKADIDALIVALKETQAFLS
jgi:cysteine desulfurase/selenocysteine lyase